MLGDAFGPGLAVLRDRSRIRVSALRAPSLSRGCAVTTVAPPRRVTWISQEEWRALLRRSADIQARIPAATARGENTDALWRELRPVNLTIRSDLLKVRGIDDRVRGK